MNNITHAHTSDEEAISFFDIFTVIGQSKLSLLSFTLVVALSSTVVSYMLTPVFTAKTLIMPPQQQQNSAASGLASLGALAGVATSAINLKSPDDMYVSFMTSHIFQKKIIDRFKLMGRYNCILVVDCRGALNSHARILSDKKSTLMTIEVDDIDPTFAANVANAYAEELGSLLGTLAVTEAQQRRFYFETQIKKTQFDLTAAEEQFRSVQQQFGLQVPSINAETAVKEISDLHGQIAAREIQLQALNLYSTPANPDVIRLVTELTAMRMHLQKVERGSRTTSRADSVQQQALQAYRNMRVQESMLEAFAKQFELARVDESKEGPLVQVVDPATPPEKRSSPKRTLIVLVSTMVALVLAMLFILIRHTITISTTTPRGQAKLNALKQAWKI